MDATEEFSEAPNPFTPTAPSNYKKFESRVGLSKRFLGDFVVARSQA